MNNEIQNITAIRKEDLTSPSATPKYAIGTEVTLVDEAGYRQTYKYARAHAALVAGGAYVINPSLTSVRVTAMPATSSVAKEFGFAPVAFNANDYGFLLVEGRVTNATSAGATTAGNTCTLVNGASTVDDSGLTTETSATIGVLATTSAGAGTVTVIVKRKSVTI